MQSDLLEIVGELEALELTLVLLAAVLASSVIAQLVPRASSPLVQIALGVVIALLAPAAIDIKLDPELFLILFIAPLLYCEAKESDKQALWKYRKSLLSYAIGLVVAIVLVVGFAIHLIVPNVTLAAAFALAAALGPTDPVAVAAVSKNASIKPRHAAILKGESLINDASGLVSFQFAVAAVCTGSFSLIDAGQEFVISFFGALVLGLILGAILNFATRKIADMGLNSTTFHVLLDVFTPFIVYLLAEELGVSGVITVVLAGLVGSIHPDYTGPSAAKTSIVSTSVWRVLAFALNGIVFVMLGTQLPRAMSYTWESGTVSNEWLIVYILLITIILVAVRFVWSMATERIHAYRNDSKHPLCWADAKRAMVLTLAGSKGCITLAIMFTLPVMIEDPTCAMVPFPNRDLLLFLACGVILCTLLLATFAVPLLAPRPKSSIDAKSKLHAANIEILRKTMGEVAARATSENRSATDRVVSMYAERIERLKAKLNAVDSRHMDEMDAVDEDVLPAVDLDSRTRTDYEELVSRVRLQALHWEWECVQKAIDDRAVPLVEGYEYLNRIIRMESLISHGGDLGQKILYRVQGLRAFLGTAFQKLQDKMPLTESSEHAQAVRMIQLRSCKYALGKLRGQMPDPDIPSEAINDVMVQYQRIHDALMVSRPSITQATRMADAAMEVQHTALNLELENIRSAYEAGDLTRAEARKLRENVRLMLIDLEEIV